MVDSTADAVRVAGLDGRPVRWLFQRTAGGAPVVWDWGRGEPGARSLHPVRRPASGDHSRHVPVRVFSRTTGGHIAVESGLEHDLVRRLDRMPEVVWLVAQPARVELADGCGHVPDLLSVARDGGVTVWDCRPEPRLDAQFTEVAAVMALACVQVGWAYQVFSGVPAVERLNLIWVACSRREPSWMAAALPRLREVIGAHGATVGQVLMTEAKTNGQQRGQLMALVWHLVWRGIWLWTWVCRSATTRC